MVALVKLAAYVSDSARNDVRNKDSYVTVAAHDVEAEAGRGFVEYDYSLLPAAANKVDRWFSATARALQIWTWISI